MPADNGPKFKAFGSSLTPRLADGGGMELANDLVEFVPEPSQLARVTAFDPAAAPPAWLAVALIAVALGVSLSLALPPATRAAPGSVSDGASRSDLFRASDLRTRIAR